MIPNDVLRLNSSEAVVSELPRTLCLQRPKASQIDEKVPDKSAESMTTGAIRIAVVDSDEVVRRTLCLLIRVSFANARLEEFHSGEAALAAFAEKAPDIALLEIQMTGISGIRCAERIRECFPFVRTVLVSGHARAEYIHQGFRSGVMGYLLKPPTSADLNHAILGALEGRLVLSEGLRKLLYPDDSVFQTKAVGSFENLSPQETKVISLICEGHKDRAIALEMGISENTVKWHVKHVLRKLGASCRAQAVSRFDASVRGGKC